MAMPPVSGGQTRAPPNLVIMVLVFGSGAAGLAYEISWSRQLGLTFGQTARAAAIVLAAYFLGMALGYAMAGRISARMRRPLAGFAIAEVGVGLWALALPSALGVAPSAISDGLTRVLVALLVLLPGTTALGASLPFVAQAVAGGRGTQRVAEVYAVNLAGALVGVVASTAVLAPLGVVSTSWAAAGLSISVGAAAWAVRGRFEAQAHRAQAPTTVSSERSALWIIAAAGSGFGSLGAQVLYMRLFSLVFHNSTYTFAAILVVVLFGLSLSSALGAWALRRWDARLLLVGACGVAAASLPLSVYLMVQIRGLRYFSWGDSFLGYIAGAAGLVSAVVLVPVLAMGLLLPLAWHLAGADHRPGRIVGRLTTANTLAAAAGALMASFVLLPALDLWWSFTAFAATYLAIAALMAPGLPEHRRRVAVGLSAASILVLGLGFASARFKGLRRGELLTQRFSGPYGWIDVTRNAKGDVQYLRQNIHYGLGSRRASAMELRQGHLPLLLHPAPARVAFVGLATGVTASAALDVPEVKQITIMELIPEVVDAARLFAQDNAGLLDDPRVKVIVDDGRNALGLGTERYDVIVSDLFVPWESKTGYLYTVEHYSAVRARMAKAGIFCQWLAGWQIGPGELDIIAQSMRAVFPHVSIWQFSRRSSRPLFALIGTNQASRLERERLNARLKQRRPPADQDKVLRTAADVVARYHGDWIPRPEIPLNMDEHPVIEFSAPMTHRTRGRRLHRRGYQSYYQRRLSQLPREVFTFEPPAGPDEVFQPQ